MCTVALAHRLFPGLPLLLAANRDEQRGRPSTSWHTGSVSPEVGDAPHDHTSATADRIFAPRDRVAGGTWIGINAHGLVAAITNRFGHARDPARRSRGLLVLDALTARDVDEAVDRLGRTEPQSVSPFHLLIATAQRAALVFHDGAQIHTRPVAPGWTVITERSRGAASNEREARVHEGLSSLGRAQVPAPERLHALLGVHVSGDALEERVAATCVHIDEVGYGTRSSSLLYLPEAPGGARLFHAEGPPCVTPQVELSDTLRQFQEGL